MTADAVGGVWSYALELARALAPHGVDVQLATMGPRPSAAQRASAAAVPNATLHESDHRLEWMDEPWDDVERAGDWLAGLERDLAPDVVHLNGYAHGARSWRAPTVVVAHSCVASWWRAVRGEAAPPSWDRYRAAVRAGLDGADVVLAPTRAMLDMLIAEYGPVDGARVVPNGRDAAAFRPARKEPIVLTVGRLWDDAKNVAAVVAAAEGMPWHVHVAGDAAPPAHTGGGHGATGNVRWLGTLAPAEVAGWMGRAAVYALPARYEPFGLSALEAALSGCALVLGDVPSLREVWGDAATYVPPDRPELLRAAITTLLTDDPRRAERAAAARTRALAYTPARTASGTLDAYAAAAAAHPEALPCAS
jgi:glycosyltransferase involved in cell wall biosynthesis